ncbi:PD-(D/E)XK nuclease family protein [Geomobilimonas luticola]|uniref:Exodeoxyribonuclease V subunit gamma n=1 Tax=Geomobilimonas luticola TaxID=1114878 RepID=A0ABS5S9Y3_9BACT|nr:PD-(D/E)XK nuclease family protein [Geomobilimonas luticola]MBT0652178.1 exodeoxyribonuclease V subunit gamma [Geomobilimonas luticola]
MTDRLHIFPSTAAVEAFDRDALAERGIRFGTRALTLKRLSEELYAAADDERRPISAVGRKLLLGDVATRHYADGAGVLARLIGFPGFVTSLDSLFGELKQALITADAFTVTVRAMPANGRLTELAALYGLYCQTMTEQGLLDSHDQEHLALEELRNGKRLPPLFDGITGVTVHAIYDFTPLQLALIAELSRRMPVTLHLPYNPDRETLYAYVARTADRIESLGDSDLLLEPVFEEPQGRFLSLLRSAVFSTGEERPIVPPASLSLMSAPGSYRECEEIGRRIRDLMEKGTDPASIAVICRDLRNYGPMLEDVCRRFAIPVSYRRGAPLATAPLVHACLAPLTLVQARLGREELLALLKSGYFDLASHGLDPDQLEEVLLDVRYLDETFGRLEELLERRIAWLSRRHAANREDRETERRLASTRAVARELGPLIGELRRFGGARTFEEFSTLLAEFIDRHRLYRRAIDAADPRALKRDASAITLLQQVLADLARDIRVLGMEERTFTPAGFLELLPQGMTGVFLAGERQSGVSIMNFHDARGLRFPHVFIAGLNEGICPPRHDGHPLFKDNDKLPFQKTAGTRPFRTAVEKGEEEPLLFYLAIGCAGETLTLSYSYVDGRGNDMLRSPLLDELLAAVPLAEVRIPMNRLIPEPADCREREELLNSLARSRRFDAALAVPELAPAIERIAATAAIEAEREAFFNAEEVAVRAALSTPYTGTLRDPAIQTDLRAYYTSSPGNRFAPTTLEEFGCCPFRYFLKRLVRLAPVEKPELELAVKDEGSLVHEILQRFFEERQEGGRLPLRGDTADKDAMAAAAAEVFARWEAERTTGEPLLWELGKEKLLPLLERLVELEAADDAGLVPTACELPFTDLEVIDLDGSSIFLRGKIDRVDVSPDGDVRVVDYKLAGNSQRYRQLMQEENLGEISFQVPVYLLAAAAELERQGHGPLRKMSARYWLLRKVESLERPFGGGESAAFFATDPRERSALGDGNFLNRLCAKVRAMKRGEFPVTPRECERCDFASVCRYVAVGLRDGEGGE